MFVVAMFLVGGGIHQGIQFCLVGEFHLDNPTGAERILIDELRLVFESFVHLDHGAADWSDEVAGSFNAFHSAEFLACGYFVVFFGHININHVAESVLSVVADADDSNVSFYTNILV